MRNCKTSEKQFDILLDFMSNNKILLTNKYSPSEGPEEIQSLWAQLTILLNSAGTGPAKTVDGWKKTWNEYKCNTKKRARAIKIEQKQTGGGEQKNKQLSDRDKRLLQLLSHVTVEGLEGVAEPGLLEPLIQNTEIYRVVPTASDINILGPSTQELDVLCDDTPGLSTQLEMDSVEDISVLAVGDIQKFTATKIPQEGEDRKAKRRKIIKNSSAAEKATAAYAAAMEGRNQELSRNTVAITEMAAAIRELAAAMHAVANALNVNK